MAKLVVIGDVHGKTQQYQKMIRQKFADRRTVQIGDMGIGFKGVGLHKMDERHGWFRGNHDDPAKCRTTYNYMGDWGYNEPDKFFWVAGAVSIDRDMRIENVSWWRDEELSYAELDYIIQEYDRVRPNYILSHEAPRKAADVLLYTLSGDYFAAKRDCANSRTAQALQCMLDIHAPKEWIFGHYHFSHSFAVPFYDTKFTCVSELDTYELNTDPRSGYGE